MSKLQLQRESDDIYTLLRDFTLITQKYKITVKAGFDFDGASIPKAFWSVIGSPFNGAYVPPAVIHDGLYASEALPREVCDEIFLELMKQFGVSYVKRYSMYWSVRAGGTLVWKNHTKEEVKKYKGFCNVEEIIS